MKFQDARANHPAVKALHVRSEEKEVTKALKEAGILNEWGYAKDSEFEQYVLKDIQTPEQAKAFIAMLNADAHAMGRRDCTKTWGLKNVKRDFKKYSFLTIASLLSASRRTHCGCHLVGSFALSERYHEGIKEFQKTRTQDRKKKIEALYKIRSF